MLPPFSGVDLVRVMRAEMEGEHRKAEHHLPFESAEDFDWERKSADRSPHGVRGLIRFLPVAIFSPDRTKT